jgi:hypothetical protein
VGAGWGGYLFVSHTKRISKIGVSNMQAWLKLNCFIMRKSKGKVLKCFGNILNVP